MDDIDEHLFMLIRLKPDNNQEIGLLILPMLSGPNPATSVKNNFNSVFEILSVGVSSFNRKGNPDSLQNELFKEISKFSGTPKVILSFLDSAHDNLRTQNFLFSKLADLKNSSPVLDSSPLLECLPKIQEILGDMQTLEELKVGENSDQFAQFKAALIEKVNTYLSEIRSQRQGWFGGGGEMNTSLVREYEEQLEGILEALVQEEGPMPPSLPRSSPHRNDFSASSLKIPHLENSGRDVPW